MKNIVILGAGTAGTMVVNALARRLNLDEYALTIVDRSEKHYYQPGLLFIPFKLYGYEDVSDIARPITDLLPKEARFVQAQVERIDPARNTVVTSDGELHYDWLICALGCRVAPEEVDGLIEAMDRSAYTFYTLPGAMSMQQALDRMESGRLVIDIAELPIKCPVAPIEAAFLADYYFHQKGIRHRIDITLVSPFSSVFTKPNASKVLTELAWQKDIELVTDFSVQRVDGERKLLIAYDGRQLDYDLLCIVPPTLGPKVLETSGLNNETGYGLTEPRTLKAKKAENIYFIGDNTDVPTSKAGSVAHFESETVVENLLRELEGQSALPSFDGHANCFIESGFHRALLIDFNYDAEPLPGKFPVPSLGPFSLLQDTYMNHMGKMMFKWVYWNLLVTGVMPEIPFVPAQMSFAGKDMRASPSVRRLSEHQVSDVMSRDVITIALGTPIGEAARLMQERDVSGLPVVDAERKVCGVITEGDLLASVDLRHNGPGQDIVATLFKKGRTRKLGSRVDDLMTSPAISVPPEQRVDDAVGIMDQKHVKRLIVIDKQQRVVGIVARSDLLSLLHA